MDASKIDEGGERGKSGVLPCSPARANACVVWDDAREGVISDGGTAARGGDAGLANFIAREGLRPVLAANTHGHFDHTLGVEHLRQRYGIPFALSGKDRFLLENAATSSAVFGVKIGTMPPIDRDLDAEEEIRFGETALRILRTPGHTPGHVALYEPQSKALFTGDTLFRESIGRTDLPGGDYSWIMRSILDVILPLGDEVHVYPGHGPETTLGHETLYNPFIVEVLNGEVNSRERCKHSSTASSTARPRSRATCAP